MYASHIFFKMISDCIFIKNSISFIFLNKFIYLFIFGCVWVFIAVHGLFSSCGEWGLLFVVVHGLLIVVASFVAEHGFQGHGLQQLWHVGSVVVACGLQQLWLMDCRAQAQQLWRTGLVAPRHGRSSWTRARTYVPCIGRQILNHCATREVPQVTFC